jgi:hypothetical protein
METMKIDKHFLEEKIAKYENQIGELRIEKRELE